MLKTNTLTVIVKSKKYEISIEDDFTIWISDTLYKDFHNKNISRKELL